MVEGSLFQGPDILDQIVREAVRKGDRLYMEDRPVPSVYDEDMTILLEWLMTILWCVRLWFAFNTAKV